eukprot:5584712-Pyramimonas_sp.AAC.1
MSLSPDPLRAGLLRRDPVSNPKLVAFALQIGRSRGWGDRMCRETRAVRFGDPVGCAWTEARTFLLENLVVGSCARGG